MQLSKSVQARAVERGSYLHSSFEKKEKKVYLKSTVPLIKISFKQYMTKMLPYIS